MDARFRIPLSPVAHDAAVVQGDRYRITVLTAGLVRIEWAEDGVFEDRASTFALHRDLPVPEFRVVNGAEVVEVVSDRFHVTYDRGRPSASGLKVDLVGGITAWHSTWRFGDEDASLHGTARTLDVVDGRTPLGPGVIAEGGVAVLDDSASFLLTEEGWVAPRPEGERFDLYVFAAGHDFTGALADLYAVSGDQPLLPRWALGNWWSRYHRYTADEYLELLDRFEREGVRFSVAVIDMDWHRVESVPPEYGSGWTGYSWEKALFPDPEDFLADLHRRGLRVTLNVHPADGVRAFEDAYAAMCLALGQDPEERLPITFDVTDPAFLEAYFDVLHHGLEEQGVDFWWLDWQQGPHSRVAGIDPLWMLNHYHFLDSGREGRRPLTFSRYAGPGSHRYPVGFSGDAVISWASLDFQPEFTATASNIGYGWWSHDIGGHLWGVRDDELQLRWVQLGVWSPILRLHSSNNPFLAKEPWAFPAETRTAIDEALRLRVRLVPYLHTMNRRAAEERLPLVLPVYYEAPGLPAAYRSPNVFRFGSELVIAPITTPRDPGTLQGRATAWLPPGTWIDIATAIVHEGGRTVQLHRDTSGVPALLQAGGILPLAAEHETDATANPAHLEVLVAPGADGAFVLVEDDGTGTTPDTVPTVRTPLRWDQATGTLTIGAADGPSGIVPETRTWTVTVLGLPADTALTVNDAAHRASATGSGRVSVTLTADATSETAVVVGPDPRPATQDVAGRVFALLNTAQYPYEDKAALWAVVSAPRSAASRLAELQALTPPEPLLSAVTELLTAL